MLRHDPFPSPMTDAADTLLLSLEVEAAAARNAELSRTVEALQKEVRQLRSQSQSVATSHPSPTRGGLCTSPSSAPEPSPLPPLPLPSLDEPREVYLALDDLLFEVADIRSHLASCEAVDLTPRTFDPATTVTARALRCVDETKKLKAALAVSQQSSDALVAELRRALGEQVAANERQQSLFAVQRAALERRCDDLQRQRDDMVTRQGEKMLDRVIQSPCRHGEPSV